MSAPSQPSADVHLKRRPWLLLLASLMLLLALFVMALPTIVVKSGKIQSVIQTQLGQRHCDFSMQSMRVGWITPIRLTGIKINDQRGRWKFGVNEVDGNRNLWQLITSPRDLGTLVIESPDITVRLDAPEKVVQALDELTAGEQRDGEQPPTEARIRVVIRNGAVHALVPKGEEPVDVATQISADIQWQQTREYRRLSLAPGRIVKDVQLTPEICNFGIQFVAPVLANVAWTGGSMALELERCNIDLEDLTQTDVVGKLSLFSVEAGLTNEVAAAISEMTSMFTTDKLPTSVRLAENSLIEFQVADGAVRHQGLEFGLPEVSPDLVVRTEGSVSFDEQLDLVATVPLPFDLLGEGKIAQALGHRTIKLPIHGTLDEPQVEVQGTKELVSELLEPITSGEIQAADVLDVLQDVRALIQNERRQSGESESRPLFPGLRRLLQESDDGAEP